MQTVCEHPCIHSRYISVLQILKWSPIMQFCVYMLCENVCVCGVKLTMHAPKGQSSGNAETVQALLKCLKCVSMTLQHAGLCTTQCVCVVLWSSFIPELKISNLCPLFPSLCIYPLLYFSMERTCLYEHGVSLVVRNGTQLLHHRHRQPSEWWFLLCARVRTYRASVQDNMIDWMLFSI